MSIISNIAKRMGYAKVGKRQYAAARIDRTTNDWIHAPTSANEELKAGGIDTIRNRARELERDDDLTRKYLSMVEANVVGRGFVLRVDSQDPAAREIERMFTTWLEYADISGQLSGCDIQRLVVRSAARDGESFVRLYKGAGKNGLALQIIESDYIDHRKTTQNPDGTAWIMGVKVNKQNAPLAYSVFTSHPGDRGGHNVGQMVIDIPADELIHIFRQERAGQVRAASWMSSSMMSLKMLRGYQVAEIIAARAAACKMGFYKIPPGEDFTADGAGSGGEAITDASPGQFERMPSGWEFQQYDPQHPTSQYGQFVKDMIRGIAGGLEVAYNNLASDLEGVSYSSIRQGTLEEREQWISKQNWFASCFMRRLYRSWIEMATTTGDLKITMAQMAKYRELDVWTGRRWPWVDPLNDIQTKEKEIALGLTSPSEIAAESGRDYAKVQAKIAADNSDRTNNGLPAVSAVSSGAVQDTALNGAQISSVAQLVSQAAAGMIPSDSVAPILQASFPGMSDEEIDSIVKPLKSFTYNPKAGA